MNNQGFNLKSMKGLNNGYYLLRNNENLHENIKNSNFLASTDQEEKDTQEVENEVINPLFEPNNHSQDESSSSINLKSSPTRCKRKEKSRSHKCRKSTASTKYVKNKNYNNNHCGPRGYTFSPTNSILSYNLFKHHGEEHDSETESATTTSRAKFCFLIAFSVLATIINPIFGKMFYYFMLNSFVLFICLLFLLLL
jgi:hypothetical protein